MAIEGVAASIGLKLLDKILNGFSKSKKEKRKMELFKGFLEQQKKHAAVYYWRPDIDKEENDYKLLMELVKEGYLFHNPHIGFTLYQVK